MIGFRSIRYKYKREQIYITFNKTKLKAFYNLKGWLKCTKSTDSHMQHLPTVLVFELNENTALYIQG